MRINEIFSSVDGEINGFGQGRLATFVRLQGCNMNCYYCDTKQSIPNSAQNYMSVSDVLNEISYIGIRNVTLTGGEPLLQANTVPLISELLNEGYKINLETNGTVALPKITSKSGVTITMDDKFFRDEGGNFVFHRNPSFLTKKDTVKFVIDGKEGFDYFLERIEHYPNVGKFALSPVVPDVTPSQLIIWMKESKVVREMTNVQLNVQLHKLIGER